MPVKPKDNAAEQAKETKGAASISPTDVPQGL
jgi:hypothetical protein